MRRAERLFRLVDELRSRRVTRAAELAAALEVSPRTVYRDIAHLQASGLPIEGEAGVGYLLSPRFDLPAVTFTHDQLEALAVGLAMAESLDDPTLASAAREARAKLQTALPRPETRSLMDAPFFALRRKTGAPTHAALVRRAIRQRRILQLSYADATGNPTTRRLRPLAIWAMTDGWMFSGWCELRADFRTWRFDRVVTLALAGDHFPDDPDKSLAAFRARDACEASAH
ncbi:MAG: YafY family transcriptional regulator [Rhodobacterales bacterium]|nr:YafY family transcriptional regulator [Rhodobacterales bacterium]